MSVPPYALGRPRSAGLGLRLLLGRLGRLRHGSLTVALPSGEPVEIAGSEPGPSGVMQLQRPWAVNLRVAWRGVLGLGESFVAGDWDSPEPTALLALLAANEQALLGTDAGPGRWSARLAHRRRRNTRRGSRRNIQAHYDLGNDFYRLWLDETMTYSGAEFATADHDLAAAQRHKYRRILDALDLQPGQKLLEIGCGWGGLALEAARRGASVTALTLSREQLAFARARLEEAGLAHRVELRLQDYRELTGEFDALVSVEMLEAVGEEYWPRYFRTLHDRVRPGGRVLVHGIVIHPDWFEGYRRNPDFIQRHVFPGGMLPTRDLLVQGLDSAGLRLEDETALGSHYARTLAQWQRRFVAQAGAVAAQGFDLRFRRLWRYYLAYCEAGFLTDRLDLLRLTLQRAPS